MSRVVTERALYNQLAFFRRLLDVERALKRLPEAKRDAARARLGALQAVLEPARAAADAACKRSEYAWVNLSVLCGGGADE